MIGIYEQFKGDDKQDWAVFALIFVRHRLISFSMRHFFSLIETPSVLATDREGGGHKTGGRDLTILTYLIYVALIIPVMDNLMSSD